MTDSLSVPNFGSCKNSSVPAIKPKAKYIFHTPRILTVYKNITVLCEIAGSQVQMKTAPCPSSSDPHAAWRVHELSVTLQMEVH